MLELVRAIDDFIAHDLSLDELESLLDKHINLINTPYSALPNVFHQGLAPGDTLIVYVAKKNGLDSNLKLNLLNLLKAKGANPNQRTTVGNRTTFVLTDLYNREEYGAVSSLILVGGRLSDDADFCRNTLLSAITGVSPENQSVLARLINEFGVDPNTRVGQQLMPAIAYAAEVGNFSAVRFLLDNPNTRDVGQALLGAIWAWQRNMVRVGSLPDTLIALASDERCDEYRDTVDRSHAFGGGQTALHKLCNAYTTKEKLGVDVAKILIDQKGFRLDIEDVNGKTPLQWLSDEQFGNRSLLRQYFEDIAQRNLNVQRQEGPRPF